MQPFLSKIKFSDKIGTNTQKGHFAILGLHTPFLGRWVEKFKPWKAATSSLPFKDFYIRFVCSLNHLMQNN